MHASGEPASTIATTLGVNRATVYRLRARRRSSARLHCPTVTQPEVVEKIIRLRQRYHFGPMKIAMYLKRYHDVEISASGVWRILKRLGMNRLPASQRYKRHAGRWKRYEKQRPGHHVRIDVKFIEPIATGLGRLKRYYQQTAIDDCTRLRVLRAYPRSDQKTAIHFLDYVLSRLPFQVEEIQTEVVGQFEVVAMRTSCGFAESATTTTVAPGRLAMSTTFTCWKMVASYGSWSGSCTRSAISQ